MQLNQNYILQLSIIIMCVKYMVRDLYYKQTVFMFHMINRFELEKLIKQLSMMFKIFYRR